MDDSGTLAAESDSPPSAMSSVVCRAAAALDSSTSWACVSLLICSSWIGASFWCCSAWCCHLMSSCRSARTPARSAVRRCRSSSEMDEMDEDGCASLWDAWISLAAASSCRMRSICVLAAPMPASQAILEASRSLAPQQSAPGASGSSHASRRGGAAAWRAAASPEDWAAQSPPS
eukprot:CAMPEP_0195108804 /NCGR_PEP_ID=MMETSP0448-20130528/86761_1 /TAXON_ID=66468 /ORGANISM="Heterocapsa triquestra, Strain CCMP 448" /LENGTH=174 /DNA_ID=CAMNT_0040145375 /DNA_START=425 /DNA_END=946 /DNA_ORIENTATION=-